MIKFIFKPISLLFYTLLCLFLFASCRQNPDPEMGFNESFYIKMDFQGESLHIEDEDVETQYFFGNGGGHYGFHNIFESANSPFDIEVSITFFDEIQKADITALEGDNLPITRAEGEFPFVRIFLLSNTGGQEYSTDVENVEYGSSVFGIDEVIKGPKVTYNEPIGGEEKTGRSYILRGSCAFDISKSSWTLGVPDTLYPITNGEFSLRVILP